MDSLPWPAIALAALTLMGIGGAISTALWWVAWTRREQPRHGRHEAADAEPVPEPAEPGQTAAETTYGALPPVAGWGWQPPDTTGPHPRATWP